MIKIIRITEVFLIVLILLSFLQCNTQKTSNCSSKKIQLLIEDLLKKGRFSAYSVDDIGYPILYAKDTIGRDSSMYFGYLISPELKIPDKDFYLHWNNELAPSYPDSVKLRVIKNNSEMSALTYVLGFNLSEINEDTTKLMLSYGFGLGKILHYEGTLRYSFDEKNCKWIVLDSSKTFY